MTDMSRVINPPTRGRNGVPPLEVAYAPRATELAFDKLGLRVKAVMKSLQPAPSRDVFDHYREIMIRRAILSNGLWSSPMPERAVFRTKLKRKFGTITNTTIWARWEDDRHTMNIWLNVNPTRTLRHLLARYPGEGYLGAVLESLTLEDFFGVTPEATHAGTLDGNDNVFDDLRYVREQMSENHAAAFMATFERQVRRWFCEAVAPYQGGFREEGAGLSTWLASDCLGIEVQWSNVVIRDLEVYFERRRSNAAALMNRINHAVLAGHNEVQWRHHDLGERGGRSGGSTSIGVRQTEDITLAYYAKLPDRIRGEVRYRRGLRDLAEGMGLDVGNPLHKVLMVVRNDAVSRLRWEEFCRLAGPMPIITAADLARLAAVVAKCAHRSNVDAEPVLRALLETGGINETPHTGPFPRRLNKRLEGCGVLWRNPLQPRSRPGHSRRYVLEGQYLEVVRLAQLGLAQAAVRA
jgi:hypothetical protein